MLGFHGFTVLHQFCNHRIVAAFQHADSIDDLAQNVNLIAAQAAMIPFAPGNACIRTAYRAGEQSDAFQAFAHTVGTEYRGVRDSFKRGGA